MQQLVPLKLKIALIVVMTLVVLFGAKLVVDHPVPIGLLVAAVEAIVLFLATKSWPLFTVLPFRPGWARVNWSGKWIGEIVSQYGDASGNQVQPIGVEAEIRQTWSEFAIHMQTAKMRSRTSGSFVQFDPALSHLSVRYFYSTQPGAAWSGANPPQNMGSGLALLDMAQPDSIRITYTNERNSGGEINLRREPRRRGRLRFRHER